MIDIKTCGSWTSCPHLFLASDQQNSVDLPHTASNALFVCLSPTSASHEQWQCDPVYMEEITERFSIGCQETNSKVITSCKPHDELIRRPDE